MPVSRADLQSALDAALAERTKLEFIQLFNSMFTGQKTVAGAVKTFKTGVADHLEAHAEASRVIAELIKE